MPRTNILDLLAGGDRRTIGLSDKVVAIVSQNPRLFPKLIAGLWSDDPLVRMRSADATEKVTRSNRQLLRPYRKELRFDERDQAARIALASGRPSSTAPAERQGTPVSVIFIAELSWGPQFNRQNIRAPGAC
jgi:hypothetical protein